MPPILRLALAAPLLVALAAAGPEDKPRRSDGMVVQGSGPGTDAGSGPSDVGIRLAASQADAEGRNRLTPARFLAADLIGITVRDNAGNELGTAVDLVMEEGRSLTAVVLDVGGFLGVATRYVAVQPAGLILSPGGGRDTATLDMGTEQIASAPDFKFGRHKSAR